MCLAAAVFDVGLAKQAVAGMQHSIATLGSHATVVYPAAVCKMYRPGFDEQPGVLSQVTQHVVAAVWAAGKGRDPAHHSPVHPLRWQPTVVTAGALGTPH